VLVKTSEVSAAELGQLYLELHHRLHRLVDDTMNASGLSIARAKVLGQLAENGPMNQASIATRLGLAARSVTDTVDSLERDSLAARQSDPNDRRAWIVAITPAGSKALATAMAARAKVMNQIFESLDARQRDDFAALLVSIRTSVIANSGD
jgi:DNA-binding MarR family transcriptional regulator